MLLFLLQVSQLFSFSNNTTNSCGITHGGLLCLYFFCFTTFISSFRRHLLAVIMFHVIVKAGLGLLDTDAWHMIETIAEKNNIGYKQFVSQLLLYAA